MLYADGSFYGFVYSFFGFVCSFSCSEIRSDGSFFGFVWVCFTAHGMFVLRLDEVGL